MTDPIVRSVEIGYGTSSTVTGVTKVRIPVIPDTGSGLTGRLISLAFL